MSDRYVVAGNPVAHSRSPYIHAQFARQTAQDLRYTRMLVDPAAFPRAVRDFFAAGGKGMNITVPFKLEAFELAEVRSERALQAQAVNTLWLDAHGRLNGDNTDGAGLVRDLQQNLQWRIDGSRILLLGAGGAARGVIGPLLAQRPRELVLANRSRNKAEALVQSFDGEVPLSAQDFAALQGRFDIVINATSASLKGEVPLLPQGLVDTDTCCYDMAYADQPTAFLAWAAGAGSQRLADGLGMLVEQAAESFFIWRGVRPDTLAVIEALRGGVSIREAQGTADFAAAAALFREYQQSLGVDLCFQDFEAEVVGLPGAYAAPRGTLLLAVGNGQVLGCVALRPIADEACEMKRLYVRSSARGLALGRSLAVAVIGFARAAGYRRMRLDTLDRLHEAMQLYRSLGFRACAPYYDNPLPGVVFQELDLHQEAAPE
jgi:shikimate dehydrogenase